MQQVLLYSICYWVQMFFCELSTKTSFSTLVWQGTIGKVYLSLFSMNCSSCKKKYLPRIKHFKLILIYLGFIPLVLLISAEKKYKKLLKMKFKSVQSFRSLSSLDRAITKNYLAMVFLNQSLYQQTSGVTYHEKHLFRFSSLYIYPSQTLGLLTIYNKFHKALHAEFIFAVSRKNMSIQVTFKSQIIGTIS